MKILNLSYLFLFACLALFSSCGRDSFEQTDIDIEIPTVEDVEVNPLMSRSSNEQDGISLACFLINYPFEVVDAEGTAHTISTDTDWQTIVMDETLEIVDFVYPLELSYSNGETTTVDGNEALADAFAACPPQGGWVEDAFPAYVINLENSCYTIVYPVTLVNLAGEETIVNNDDELIAAVAEEAWFFVFPFNLEHENGTVVEVTENDDIFGALFSCSGWNSSDSTGVTWENGFENIGCYTIGFPMNVMNGDGEVVTVNNHQELCDLMLYGDFAGYAYPISLIDEDGAVTVVNSEEELHAALEACPGWVWDNGDGEGDSLIIALMLMAQEEGNPDCFTINYPMELTTASGSVVSVEDAEGFRLALENSGDPVVAVSLPLTVTLTDGTTVAISTTNDIFQLAAGCE